MIFDNVEKKFTDFQPSKNYFFTIYAIINQTIQINLKLKNIYSSPPFTLNLIEHESCYSSIYINEYELDVIKDNNNLGHISFKATYTIKNPLTKYISFKLKPDQYIDFISIKVFELVPSKDMTLLLFVLFMLSYFCSAIFIIIKDLKLFEYIFSNPKRKNAEKLKNTT